MTRLLADPPSRSGGILTKRELDAALRVLATLRRPQPASIVMDWDNAMQDMLGGLQRARYVEVHPAYGGRAPTKSTASFRPDMLATTDLGSEYLDSIKKASGASHATRKGKTGKTPRQLDADIAQTLAAGGEPQLAGLFADPAAAKVFAKEMRHELQKKQTSEKTAAALAARPYTVKHMDGGRRALLGRYPTEGEARTAADRIGGWIEHEGRVVYGSAPSDHAVRRSVKKKASRAHATRAAYRIKLTPGELRAVEFARGRYSWPDMLSAHASEDGSIAFTESEMWQWTDDVDADDSPFPLAAPALVDKLQQFYDSRI
jgi:hypothetical protein